MTVNHIKKCLLLLLAVLLLCSCGVQDTPAPDPQPAPAESCTIGGSFTATVRDVIPDYCLDDTTPLVACRNRVPVPALYCVCRGGAW